jgi:hypothetical protein
MADMLASPADLASLLQRSFDEFETASATLALEASTAVVQAACGGQRIVLVTDDEEEVWGGSEQVLRLKQRPVVSITSITYDGSALSEGTASGTWRRSQYGIWRDLGWTEASCEPSPITVVYTHGYAPGDQALQLARSVTLSLARTIFDNPTGVVREQIDDYAVAYDTAATALDASPSLKGLLRRQYGPKARMVRIG